MLLPALGLRAIYPELFADAGYFCYLTYRPQGAEWCLRRALEMDPGNRTYSNNLAFVLARREQVLPSAGPGICPAQYVVPSGPRIAPPEPSRPVAARTRWPRRRPIGGCLGPTPLPRSRRRPPRIPSPSRPLRHRGSLPTSRFPGLHRDRRSRRNRRPSPAGSNPWRHLRPLRLSTSPKLLPIHRNTGGAYPIRPSCWSSESCSSASAECRFCGIASNCRRWQLLMGCWPNRSGVLCFTRVGMMATRSVSEGRNPFPRLRFGLRLASLPSVSFRPACSTARDLFRLGFPRNHGLQQAVEQEQGKGAAGGRGEAQRADGIQRPAVQRQESTPSPTALPAIPSVNVGSAGRLTQREKDPGQQAGQTAKPHPDEHHVDPVLAPAESSNIKNCPALPTSKRSSTPATQGGVPNTARGSRTGWASPPSP